MSGALVWRVLVLTWVTPLAPDQAGVWEPEASAISAAVGKEGIVISSSLHIRKKCPTRKDKGLGKMRFSRTCVCVCWKANIGNILVHFVTQSHKESL